MGKAEMTNSARHRVEYSEEQFRTVYRETMERWVVEWVVLVMLRLV